MYKKTLFTLLGLLVSQNMFAANSCATPIEDLRARDQQFIAWYLGEPQELVIIEARYNKALSAAVRLLEMNSRESANIILGAIQRNIVNPASNFPLSLREDRVFMNRLEDLRREPRPTHRVMLVVESHSLGSSNTLAAILELVVGAHLNSASTLYR
jgi:hypothetical protein